MFMFLPKASLELSIPNARVYLGRSGSSFDLLVVSVTNSLQCKDNFMFLLRF